MLAADRVLMSASSTSSSTSSSREGGEEAKSCVDDNSTLKKRIQQFSVVASATGYVNSSMSTLDRSHYQSLPFNGTRRVTVLFGEKRIVVPWRESDSTVGQLAEAALRRYKRHMELTDHNRVRVLRLECASDGGILDMDDVLEEVFDLNYDQILAITDEASGSSTPTYSQIQKHNHHYAQPLPYSRSLQEPGTPIASAFGSVSVNHQAASPYNVSYAKDRRNSVVEVNSFDSAPGLQVSTPKSEQRPTIRSSLRTEASESRLDEATPTKQSRVTLSPEVEKKLAEQEDGDAGKSERRRHYEKNPGRFNRGSDRKSRINDALLEARDRIVEKLENNQDAKKQLRGKLEHGPYPGTTIINFPLVDPDADEPARQMGIEVKAVFDETPDTPSTSNSSKLSAVQVMKIDDTGRVAKDGRIRVGDCIREIDGRPVSQMSIIRARAYIGDMAIAVKDVSLLVNRPLESFMEAEETAEAKPILSALQQANTQYIGHTTIVELIKSSNGFGFTVTGRETSKGERLFYIGTVKPYGVALGHLKSGDRLLEINGESTGQFTQSEIVEKLKETMVGAKIKFLVSRVSQSQTQTQQTSSSTSSSGEKSGENKENEGVAPPATKESSPSPTGITRFDLVIPVNGSGSAGLGVSLKARVSKKSNGTKEDCGIFIKNVMHGGAAYKEGRLRVDDRIVGVEDVGLETLSNAEASSALARKLKEIGPSSPYVKLKIVRNNDYHNPGPISRDSSRITVDAPSPSSSSRMSSNTATLSVLQSPQTRATTSSSGIESVHSRQSSSASSSASSKNQAHQNVELDDTELPDTDPFDREAPGRKSLSEKRGLGAAADPQHIKLFQEIKHQRQNSAPTSSTQKRSKSQPRSLSQRNYRSPMKLVDVAQVSSASTLPRHQQQLDDSDMLNRRSQSMESINRPIESILRGTGQLAANPKVQFLQNTAAPEQQQHPFPPGTTALMRLKNEESRSRDKSRRKSVGNAMRNFFGFGSKSRDASPEKYPVQLTSVERPKGQEERARGTVVAPPPPPPPHHQGPRRGSSSGGVFVDYGEPYGLIPQYPHNTSQTLAASAPEGIRLISYSKANSSPPPEVLTTLGNSKFFYSSYREPSLCQRPRLPDTSRTPTLSSTTATQPIAISRHRPAAADTDTTKMTTTMSNSTDNKAALRSQRRPMSTMDYQHLMRTMSMPDYYRQAEASRRPRCVVSIPSDTTMTTTTAAAAAPLAPISTPTATVQVAAAVAAAAACSTRGSRTLVVERSAPRHSSSPQIRRSGSQPQRLSSGAPPPPPTQQDHHHPVYITPRRRSMRMLELENSLTVDRPVSLFLDTAEDSARRSSPTTLARHQQQQRAMDTRTRVEDRRVNTGGEKTARLVVFPNT
uniref:PDZ domain-containing protein n=1 Tax=Caenorhabditis japonica TaxID=281687 RepID=A0A8R1I472_CAEJA